MQIISIQLYGFKYSNQMQIIFIWTYSTYRWDPKKIFLSFCQREPESKGNGGVIPYFPEL